MNNMVQCQYPQGGFRPPVPQEAVEFDGPLDIS
jgi:hypothetical protein